MGGLFSLQELQECFETKDTEMLQKVLTSMPREEAEKHLSRCIDSGLWVPNAKEAAEQEAAAAAAAAGGEGAAAQSTGWGWEGTGVGWGWGRRLMVGREARVRVKARRSEGGQGWGSNSSRCPTTDCVPRVGGFRGWERTAKNQLYILYVVSFIVDCLFCWIPW